MKRLLTLLALIAPVALGSDIGRQSPCYMSGAFVDCYQPVEHTSMEGPASSVVSGYLSSGDWASFNAGGAGGVPATRAVSTTAPLTGGGNLSADRTFGITQAGAAANGYLGSADWQVFNARQPAGSYALQSTAINTTSPLAGGGDLTTTRTLSIPAATAAANGYLASGDWATFNGKGTGTVTSVTGTAPIVSSGGNTPAISLPVATVTANGYLASGDWSLFNGKDQSRTVGNLTEATSAVLTIGSGTGAVIGSGTTIQVIKAGAAANGYLGSADWQVFNARQPAGSYALQSTAINTTSPLAGGGDLTTTRTLSIPAATAAANGYLASADWQIFNARVATTRTINTTSPITGGGAMSADLTIAVSAIAQSTAGVDSNAAQRLGTNTNDNANTGNIGEIIEHDGTSNVSGSTTLGTMTSITSASLTLGAGDWDIYGSAPIQIGTCVGAGTVAAVADIQIYDSTNSVSKVDAISGFCNSVNVNTLSQVVVYYRASISGSTTYLLKFGAVADSGVPTVGSTQAACSGNPCTFYARRRR